MSLRDETLDQLRATYDGNLDKDTPLARTSVARALAAAKQAGASDRECMDAVRSRDWGRYKRYKDEAREKGWLP